jgi:hypothetical protein
VLQADLTFCLRFAWVLLLTGHIEAAERPLGLAESRCNAVGNQPKLGEVLGIRSISFYFRLKPVHWLSARWKGRGCSTTHAKARKHMRTKPGCGWRRGTRWRWSSG